MEDFHFQRRGAGTAAAGTMPVAGGGRAKPAACYDDVFGAPPRSSLAPARAEDYREIFGAAAACSIPVLDLPPPPVDSYELRQCSALDYLDIFGGFDGGDFAASYQELFASRDSNGVGAPLTSELGDPAHIAPTSNSRGLKQEMPISGVIIEGPSNHVGIPVNGDTCYLGDGTNQLNGSDHAASWSEKSDPVNRAIHKNEVHMSPGFAFAVKNTQVHVPHTQVAVGIFLDSNCSEGASEQQYLQKTVLSASSYCDVKSAVEDIKDDQRSTPFEFSGSVNAVYEENLSSSSKNQLTGPKSNGFSANMSNNQGLQENIMQKKSEKNCQSKPVLTCVNPSHENDLKVKSATTEFVPANIESLSCCSNGHSASSGAKLTPEHLADTISIYAVDTSNAEADQVQESKSGSPPFNSLLNSEDKIAEQNPFNSVSNIPENADVNGSLHSRSCSTHSISSSDQSCPDSVFVTVSDISLRTQPFRGPPPARPPPVRPLSKSNPGERNLRRTWTDHLKHDVGTGFAYKTHSFKHAMRSTPPPFDVEVDASSAAAASVAAIKEAMELAQATLRSAKVSMERKKDNLQSRRKSGLNEDLGSMNTDEDETVQDNQRIGRDRVAQLASEQTDDQKNVFTAGKVEAVFSPSLLSGDFKDKVGNHESSEETLQAIHQGEPRLSSLSDENEDRVGEWKVEEQFYEFIQSENKMKKVAENSLKQGSETRLNAKIGIVGEEPNATLLNKSGKILAVPKIVGGEGGSDKHQNPIVTANEQTNDSHEATLESYVPRDINCRQKVTLNAHNQEKRLGEFQEPLEAGQETKWRASEEAFICELTEKNLSVSINAAQLKPTYACQGQGKVQKWSIEASGCEETKKEIKVTEYLEDPEKEKDNVPSSNLSELDETVVKPKVLRVSHVSAKDIHLRKVSKNPEYENLKMSLKTDEYACFPEGQKTEQKEAVLFFGQEKVKVSNLTYQAFEWAENEDELEAQLGSDDWESDEENFNVVLGSNAKKLDSQKFSVETEKELQLNAVKLKTFSATAIKDDINEGNTGQQEGCKKRIGETIQEVQVVDLKKAVKSDQNVCKRIVNDKKIGDAQDTMFLGGQWNIRKSPQVSSGNIGGGLHAENGSEGHEKRGINEEKKESEQAKYSDEEKEREKITLEKEGQKRKLKEEKETVTRLEEEKEKERIRLEKERERERKKLEDEERERKKLEELERERKRQEEEREREREKRKIKEEKERVTKLEEEKEKERIRLEEERERERKMLEDKERERKKRLEELERMRKKIEEERERRKLEEEEKRDKLEEKESERKELQEEEKERKKLKEESERRKLEEEEMEMKKLEERKRKKLEEERDQNKLEEEEREQKKLEDEERTRTELEEDRQRGKKLEERERKKLEDEKRDRKKLDEESEKFEDEERERRLSEEMEERRKVQEEMERRKLEEEEIEKRKIEDKERIEKNREEEDMERSKLEEKEKERRKQEEERERRRLEEIERERRKLEEKARERRRIEEEERDRKLEEEKVRERKLDEEGEKERRKKEEEKERERVRLEEERDREREREKDRQAVERATREAHERAFAEARERAERAAVERITAEARQRALSEARERAEKASAEAAEKSMSEKASRDARLRSERAAVERATTEARERAVEKALAEKAAQDARERVEKFASNSREGVKQNANASNGRGFDSQFQNVAASSTSCQRYSDSLHHASFANERFGGDEGESAIRCKARMERHQRTVERAAKALAEKNLRDIIAQREQSERNRLAETLDADVKRWSNGKEGNLRALLSTLQYILGPESGWQPIPLTDVVTAPAVKKAYRRATLCVHPDKLQQRGASIQHKYICEKVFDLLKEAWNKFNSEER